MCYIINIRINGQLAESASVSIRFKIVSSFLLLGIFISAMAFFSTSKIMEHTHLGDFHLNSLKLIQEIGFVSLHLIEESFAYLVSGDVDELAEFENGRVELFNKFVEFNMLSMTHIEGIYEDSIMMKSIISNAEEMFKVAAVLFKEYETIGYVSLNNFYFYEEAVDKFISSIEIMISNEQDEVNQAIRDATDTITSFREIILLISVLAILLSGIIGYFISSNISNPIQKLLNAANQISEGNYDISTKIDSKNEFGLLSKSFSNMAAEIKQSKSTELMKRKAVEIKLQTAERMESLGLLAGAVAHDLNNIIGPIMAYPELIRMDLAAGKSVDKDLDIIVHSAQRAADVIADLLALTRRVNYEMESLDLNDLINDYFSSAECKTLKSLNPEVEFNIQLSDQKLLFKGSQAHLPKVITNLINNAYESMPEGGVLSVTTSTIRIVDDELSDNGIDDGRYQLLTIEDQGEGIPEENIAKLFDPFFTTKIKTGKSGTGLGLSVVYNVLKDHGAHIDVESKLGIRNKILYLLL